MEDPLGLGSSLCWLAQVLHKAGRTPEAEPLAREAVEVLLALGRTQELAWAYGTR